MFSCFMPCFRCLDLLFPMCCCLDLHAHMLDIVSLAMPCLDLYICMRVLCFYAYVYAFTCLYAWICVLPCFYAYIHMLRCTLHAFMHISMLIYVDRCVYMLRSMFSICFMPSSMCLRALRHVYVLMPRPCLSCNVLL